MRQSPRGVFLFDGFGKRPSVLVVFEALQHLVHANPALLFLGAKVAVAITDAVAVTGADAIARITAMALFAVRADDFVGSLDDDLAHGRGQGIVRLAALLLHRRRHHGLFLFLLLLGLDVAPLRASRNLAAAARLCLCFGANHRGLRLISGNANGAARQEFSPLLLFLQVEELGNFGDEVLGQGAVELFLLVVYLKTIRRLIIKY